MIQGVACDLVKQRDALVTVGKPSNYIIDQKNQQSIQMKHSDVESRKLEY